MTAAPLLVADSVVKRFGERQVLAAASLRAVPGEIRAILGRNGVGKSTLMKIAVGVLQPDSGVVHFRGAALLTARLAALARDGVMYVPDRHWLRGRRTLGYHVELFARRFGHGTAVDWPPAATLMDRRIATLSAGELRRAEFAVALARRPACLIADEPFRNLAPRDVETVASALRRLAAAGCAVVVSGHEVRALLDTADHVTWCTAGTTLELGAPAVARRNEAFVRDYLGPVPA